MGEYMDLNQWLDYKAKILASKDSFTAGRRNNDLVNYGLAVLAIGKSIDHDAYLTFDDFIEKCKEDISHDVKDLRSYDWDEKLYQVWEYYNGLNAHCLEDLLIDVEY